MNLKKLKDSLYVNSEGEWVYHSMFTQKAIERVGLSGFGASKENVAKNGGVYSLLRIEQVEAPDETYSAEDVRVKLKKGYKSIVGWKEMMRDLDKQFSKVLQKELWGLKLEKNPVVTVTYPKSSSSLLEDFVSTVQPLLSIKGKYSTMKLMKEPAYTKSSKAWFDYDALEEDLKNKGKSDDEILKALANAETAWNSFVENGYKLSGSYMKSMFRKYLRDLFEDAGTLEKADVVIVLDDSLTTGTSIKSMAGIANLYAEKVIPVTLFKTA